MPTNNEDRKNGMFVKIDPADLFREIIEAHLEKEFGKETVEEIDEETLKEILFGDDAVVDTEKEDTCVGEHAFCLNVLHDIYKAKNADYGNSFHETFKEEGLAMARIRLSDKLNRFKSLSKSGDQKVDNESIIDTLYDLANYAIMTIMEIYEFNDAEEKQKEDKKKEDKKA